MILGGPLRFFLFFGVLPVFFDYFSRGSRRPTRCRPPLPFRVAAVNHKSAGGVFKQELETLFACNVGGGAFSQEFETLFACKVGGGGVFTQELETLFACNVGGGLASECGSVKRVNVRTCERETCQRPNVRMCERETCQPPIMRT